MSLRGQRTGSTPPEHLVRVVVVTMGATSLAFDAGAVEGLLTTEVAGRTGVVVVQGVAYRPVDLAGRLGLQAEDDGPDTRVVLLSHGGLCGSARVARVHGLREVEPSRVLPLPRQFHGEERTWYQGLILFEGVVALALNTAWVLEGIGTGRREGPLEWYERGPRVIDECPERVIGQVPAC
jgi:hypothetical protein